MIKTFSELIAIDSFEKRYDYLRLRGIVGQETFGFDRRLNQILYTSREWSRVRKSIILRDNGCDLALTGYEIYGKIIIHHMNPLTIEQIENHSQAILDEEFLVCVSHRTHLAIHFGDQSLLPQNPIERRQNDTIPWR